MTALTLDTKIFRNADLVATQMDGETVMMSIEFGEYFGINSVGSRVWDLLEAPQRIGDICTRICEEYQVDAQQCENDILEFAGEMLVHNIVLAC